MRRRSVLWRASIPQTTAGLTIFQWWVTQIGPGFGEDAVGEAGMLCQRSGVGVHAAAFSGVVSVTAFCAGAGWLCGVMGVVAALG